MAEMYEEDSFNDMIEGSVITVEAMDPGHGGNSAEDVNCCCGSCLDLKLYIDEKCNELSEMMQAQTKILMNHLTKQNNYLNKLVSREDIVDTPPSPSMVFETVSYDPLFSDFPIKTVQFLSEINKAITDTNRSLYVSEINELTQNEFCNQIENVMSPELIYEFDIAGNFGKKCLKDYRNIYSVFLEVIENSTKGDPEQNLRSAISSSKKRHLLQRTQIKDAKLGLPVVRSAVSDIRIQPVPISKLVKISTPLPAASASSNAAITCGPITVPRRSDFPIKSVEELDHMNTNINEENVTLYEMAIKRLLRDNIRRNLNQIFTPSLIHEFNIDGTRGKKCLKSYCKVYGILKELDPTDELRNAIHAVKSQYVKQVNKIHGFTRVQSKVYRKRSAVWLHYEEKLRRKRAKCIHCGVIISIEGGSNGNMTRHLRVRHPDVQLLGLSDFAKMQQTQELDEQEVAANTLAEFQYLTNDDEEDEDGVGRIKTDC